MKPDTFRIVLVEDAEPDVFLVREALRQSGLKFDLVVLEDGEKASEFIAGLDRDETSPCPDLVLLDLNLPKQTGEKVLARLRQTVRCGRVPVLIVTSSDSPNDKALVARLGATQYFRKPSLLDDFMKLGALVRELLEARRRSAQAQGPA
jgi:two-component system, chemotaxis family, response regulator Rcp1